MFAFDYVLALSHNLFELLRAYDLFCHLFSFFIVKELTFLRALRKRTNLISLMAPTVH